MIPAYKEKVKQPKPALASANEPIDIREQFRKFNSLIVQLQESVDYLKRENSRLKSDIQLLTTAIKK